MSIEIAVRRDHQRGCGWRKEGGLYMVAGGLGEPCGKLSLALERCPTCSHGIKFSRGWTWINAEILFADVKCKREEKECSGCPLKTPNPAIQRAGLLWIGESFYKTPADWIAESHKYGISRRISAVPNDFKVGETWIMVAHIKAIKTRCDHGLGDGDLRTSELVIAQSECELCAGEGFIYTPAIFQAFKPEAVEYVVKGDETEEELEKLVKRGLTPVRVERVGDQGPIDFDQVM